MLPSPAVAVALAPPPLISVPVLRPLVVRAVFMALAGALCGLVAGVTVGNGPSTSLIGLWWAFMVLPLGVVERWAERREGGWRTKVRMALLIVATASVLLGLGGLQYQYGLGVVRGGEVATGYQRLVWVLDLVQARDMIVFVVLLTPFVASSLARGRRLRAQLGIVLLAVSLTTPLLYFCDQMLGNDRFIAVAIVFAAGAALPLTAAASDRLCARTWPPN